MSTIKSTIQPTSTINAEVNPSSKVTSTAIGVHNVNASSVGLSNVTNESKSSMFNDSTFTGNATIPSITGKVKLASYGNTTTPLTFNGGNSTGTTAYTTAFDQNGNIIEDTKYITCRFTSAALVDLYSRPKILLPSQGANSAIIVKEFELFLDNNGQPTTTSQLNLAMGFFNNVTIENGATYESVATAAGGDYPSSFARRLGGLQHAGKFFSSGTITGSIISASGSAPNGKMLYHKDVPSDQGIRAYVNRALYFTNPANVGNLAGQQQDRTAAQAFKGDMYLRIGYVVRTLSTHFTGLAGDELQTYDSSSENHT